jgi:hypothetical protein
MPVPYLNTTFGGMDFSSLGLSDHFFSLGIASNNLLQGSNLNPYPSQPQIGQLYRNPSFGDVDPMNGNHLSSMPLHLQTLGNPDEMQRQSGNMIESHSTMLLSQTMVPHSQRSEDGDVARFSQQIGANGQNRQTQQPPRWAGRNNNC